MSFNQSTVLCKFFAAGDCKRADCAFAHDLNALDGNVCRFFLQGTCFFGDECRYVHVNPEDLYAQYAPNETMEPGANGDAGDGRITEPIRISSPSAAAPPPPRPASAVGSPPYVKPERPLLCKLGMEGVCTLIDCHLRHGNVCEMCRHQALDPLDANQRAEHEKECCKAVERQMEYSFALQRSQQVECQICYEKILGQPDAQKHRFGILQNCNHSFCFDCVMNWRKQARDGLEQSALRSCPMCRSHSDFAIPSLLWPENAEQKTKTIEEFKKAMGRKPCRTFQESSRCPFGSYCWYKHVKADGTVVQLKPPGKARRRRRSYDLELDLHMVGELMDISDTESSDYNAYDSEEDLPSPGVPLHLDDDQSFIADIVAVGENISHAEFINCFVGVQPANHRNENGTAAQPPAS